MFSLKNRFFHLENIFVHLKTYFSLRKPIFSLKKPIFSLRKPIFSLKNRSGSGSAAWKSGYPDPGRPAIRAGRGRVGKYGMLRRLGYVEGFRLSSQLPARRCRSSRGSGSGFQASHSGYSPNPLYG